MYDMGMEDYGIDYPVMLATDRVAGANGGTTKIPTKSVVDKHGKIVKKFEGYRPASEFEDLIESLVKDK